MENENLEESVEGLYSYLDEVEDHNFDLLSTNHSEAISALGDTGHKYFVILTGLKTTNESKPEDKFNFYVTGYVNSIANNAIVIRKLFASGWHLQAQYVMRAQFEQQNVFLSFIHDTEFFERFSSFTGNGEFERIITPKRSHTEKILDMLLKKKGYNKATRKVLKSESDSLYDEFSSSIHGNLWEVALGGMQLEENEVMRIGRGGVSKPLPKMEKMLAMLHNYSQLIWTMALNRIKELDLLDLDNLKPYGAPIFLNHDLTILQLEWEEMDFEG